LPGADVGRVLGVDLGGRRIGLAVSDPEGILASPHGILERARGGPKGSSGRHADLRAVLDAARSLGATTIVVGLPLSMSGSVGPAARGVLEEVEHLRTLAAADGANDIAVETHDERLSSVEADRALAAAGSRGRGAPNDDAAAAVILQSWLEADGG